MRTFLPVALATGTATFIGRLFFGPAARPSPCRRRADRRRTPSRALTLVLYAVLGALVGVAATGFIRGLHCRRGLFERIKNPYLRHAIGMLLVGTPDLRAVARFRPLLRRGRRLRDDPGDPARPVASAALVLPLLFCLQARRRPRSASARARPAASSRRRCSWARRSAAPSALLVDHDPSVADISIRRPSRWSAWRRWSAAAPARR